jgi:hypothetical protein
MTKIKTTPITDLERRVLPTLPRELELNTAALFMRDRSNRR